jgi:hypothetical protein
MNAVLPCLRQSFWLKSSSQSESWTFTQNSAAALCVSIFESCFLLIIAKQQLILLTDSAQLAESCASAKEKATTHGKGERRVCV